MADLPAPVRAAIAGLIAGRGQGELSQRYARLSSSYREGQSSAQAVADAGDGLAYVAARLPATYAATRKALAEVEALPGFSPRSLLDVGCGPGTAILAALETFPEIEAVAGLDHSRSLLGLAAEMLARSGYAARRSLDWRTADIAGPITATPADLVTASYALVEIAENRIAALTGQLWALASHVLVLVEPGSRAGFARLRIARDVLIGAGARILAPCPHMQACPIIDPDWCHFSVRLARSREHRALKAGSTPFEDEKFAYLVAARDGTPAHDGRIIAPVSHGKAGHRLRICHDGAIEDVGVGPRQPAFKAAKKLEWGDGVAVEIYRPAP